MYEYEDRRRSLRRGLASILFTLVGAVLGGVLVIALANNGYLQVKSPELIQSQPNIAISTSSQPLIAESKDTSPVVAIAAQVSPAVVGIVNKAAPSDTHPWASLGGGTGSGVIFDKKGYIVTNNHVVAGAKELEVDLADGRKFTAKLVGTDPRTDLAVLKITADNLTAATFGNSDNLQVGELAVAIGNPLGEQYYGSITAGIISATRRTVSVGESQYIDLLQTDAAINPGNSGGALVNSQGEVIGINSVKISGQNVEGMGFAIPSYTVVRVANELVQNGKVTRPWLGVILQSDVSSMPSPPKGVNYGVVVTVADTGPAQSAGLHSGDAIVAVNGVKINSFSDLQRVVFRSNIGDKLKVSFFRDGKEQSLTVTLGEMQNS